MSPALSSPLVWVWPLQGSVELGGVAPCPVSAGGTEVKTEPVNTQVIMVQLQRPGIQCHKVPIETLR